MFKYDIALSFAGEDREYVGQVARTLKGRGIRVFYDEFEQAQLWGRNLFEHLTEVYQKQAKYVVIFCSRHYADKAWTKVEWRAAQARALRDKRDYILPARFDQSEIPGLPDNVAYIDLRSTRPERLCEILEERLNIEIPVEKDFANVVDVPVGTLRKAGSLVHGQRIDAIGKLSTAQILFYGESTEGNISRALESVADTTRSHRDMLGNLLYQLADFTSGMLRSSQPSRAKRSLLETVVTYRRSGARRTSIFWAEEVLKQVDALCDRTDTHITRILTDIPTMETFFLELSYDLQELEKFGRHLRCTPFVLDAEALLVSFRQRQKVGARAGEIDQPLPQRPQPRGVV